MQGAKDPCLAQLRIESTLDGVALHAACARKPPAWLVSYLARLGVSVDQWLVAGGNPNVFGHCRLPCPLGRHPPLV